MHRWGICFFVFFFSLSPLNARCLEKVAVSPPEVFGEYGDGKPITYQSEGTQRIFTFQDDGVRLVLPQMAQETPDDPRKLGRFENTYERFSPRVRKGFSLIELLTTISIVGVLTGLLLSGVMRVRERANNASCWNNLKQLGLGLQGHVAQHNEFLPNFPAWNMMQVSNTAASSPLMENVEKNPKILQCPSVDQSQVLKSSNLPYKTLYGYSRPFLGPDQHRMTVKITSFDSTVNQTAFADCAQVFWTENSNTHEIMNISLKEDIWIYPPNHEGRHSWHFVHVGKRVNIAFLDGHVGSSNRFVRYTVPGPHATELNDFMDRRGVGKYGTDKGQADPEDRN